MAKPPIDPAAHLRMVEQEDYLHWLDDVCEKIRKACVPDDIMARNALHRIEAKSQVRLLLAKHDGDTRKATKELLATLGAYQADDEDRRQAQELTVKRMAVRDAFAMLAGRAEDEPWGVFGDRMTSRAHHDHAAALFVQAGGARRSKRVERQRKDMGQREAEADVNAASWTGT